MDRERLAHVARRDPARQQGVVGGVVDAVGDAGADHRDDQPGIGVLEQHQEEAARPQEQSEQQHITGAEPVGGEAQRRLRKEQHDVERRQRQAEIQQADVHIARHQRDERWQGHDVIVADEVRARDLREQGPLPATPGRVRHCVALGHQAFPRDLLVCGSASPRERSRGRSLVGLYHDRAELKLGVGCVCRAQVALSPRRFVAICKTSSARLQLKKRGTRRQ